jgi:hypothetical protein
MLLTFTPLKRRRYRCNQFPKIVVKEGSLKSIRAALAKHGTARTIEGVLKQRSRIAASPRKSKRSNYRLK